MKTQDYVEMFASFGIGTDIDDSLVNLLNRFVSQMYSWKENDSVNDERHRMYCQCGKNISCEKFPPCKDVLKGILRNCVSFFFFFFFFKYRKKNILYGETDRQGIKKTIFYNKIRSEFIWGHGLI